MSLPFSPGLIRAPVWIRKATATAEAPSSLVNFVMPNATTDVAPAIFALISGHAYAQASSNTTGAVLRLAPGMGRRFITVDDYAQAGVGTVTVTANGTATVLTAGTDFTAETSNNVTATNLATAIDAVAGVTATASAAVVYVTPDDSTYSLTLARSVAAFATVTTGTDGAVNVGYGDLLTIGPTSVTLASGTLNLPDGTGAAPSLRPTSALGTGIAFTSASVLLSSGGAVQAGVISGDFLVASGSLLGFSSGTPGTNAADTILARATAANLRLGAAAANPPVAQTLSMQNASGTDIAGANFTIDASQGTGTGAGGSFIIRTAAAGGTGSSLNALATLLTVGPTNVTLASGDLVLPSAGQLRWSTDTGFERVSAGIVEVTDGSTGSGTLRATSVQFGTSNLPTISRTADDTLLQANGANTQEMRWQKDATVYASLNAGAVITPGSGTGVTVNKYGEVRTFIHSVTVTYAALSAAGLTADKTIATLPAKTRLVGIVADTTTPYTGGGVTAATLIVGKTTGGNEYLVSHDVLSAAIVVGDADADLGTSINRANAIQGGDLPSWTGTTAVSVRLTTTTANTDQLTAGSTTYYLTTESMP